MPIEIVRDQIKDAIISYAKIDSSIIETNLEASASSSKLARADAIKAYIDAEVAGGNSPWKPAVECATTAELSGNYNNGTNGDGATITGESNGAFPAVDGVTLTANQRILVKDGVSGLGGQSAAGNGIYTLTTVGDGSSAFVLTRATDANSKDEISGCIVPVRGGTVNLGRSFHNSSYSAANIDGSSSIVFNRYRSFSANDGVTIVSANGATDILKASLNSTNPGLTRDGGLKIKLNGTSLSLGADGLSVANVPNALSAGNGISAGGSFDGSTARSFAVNNDGSTLTVGAGGVKVSDGGITGTQLNASVAGNGISGGGGSSLSVQNDGTTITVGAGGIKVSDNGITGSQINASAAGNGLTGGGGSALSVQANGSTIAVGDTGISVASVPQALTIGNGLSSGGSFDGSTARTVTVNANGSTINVSGDGVKVADDGIGFAQLGITPKSDDFTGNGSASTFNLTSRIDSTQIATFQMIVRVYRNGQRLLQVPSDSTPSDDLSEYKITDDGSNTVITFGAAIPSGQTIIADYFH